MHRRALLAAAASALALAGCTSTQTTTLAQAKMYLDVGVTALQAAAQQYLAGPPLPSAANAALVNGIVAQMTQAKTTLDGTVAVADWQAGAEEVLQEMQQLEPLVAPYLGKAAPYVPLSIAVVQAFIASLPPPASATATPPAALTSKAAEFKP